MLFWHESVSSSQRYQICIYTRSSEEVSLLLWLLISLFMLLLLLLQRNQYLYVSPPVFFRSRSGRPRRPWPSSTKHRTSSSDQACWLAPCSVPTLWLKEDFRYRSLTKFLSHRSQQKLPGDLSQASWHLYIGFCNKRRRYYVENSSLQLHQPNAVQSVWCVSVIRM